MGDYEVRQMVGLVWADSKGQVRKRSDNIFHMLKQFIPSLEEIRTAMRSNVEKITNLKPMYELTHTVGWNFVKSVLQLQQDEYYNAMAFVKDYLSENTVGDLMTERPDEFARNVRIIADEVGPHHRVYCLDPVEWLLPVATEDEIHEWCTDVGKEWVVPFELHFDPAESDYVHN